MGSPGGVRWAWPNAVRPPGSRTSPPYPVAPAFDGPRVRPTPLPARLVNGAGLVIHRVEEIRAALDNFLYRTPRDAHDGFERIKMGDNVGVLLMDNKAYLAFDELDLYLLIEPKTLEKYGITKVANWEEVPT